MGLFDKENRPTKPRHRHTQDGGPPGSVQDERRRERRHPMVGRTPGSPEPLLAPTGPIFGGKNDTILIRRFPYVYDGPITHNLAKILQKEVNPLLFETNFNIFENVILPKCSTLILLRHVHKKDWNTKQLDSQFMSTSSDQSELVRTNQIGPASSDHQKKWLYHLIPATSEGP